MNQTSNESSETLIDANDNDFDLDSSDQALANFIRLQYEDRRRQNFISLMIVSVYLGLISLIGIIGNGFTIYVYGLKLQRTTSNILICVLGVIDLIISTVVTPSSIIELWDAEVHTNLTCKLSASLRAFVVIMSTFILVFIAFDRFLILCFFPSIRISHRQLKIILALIMLVALLMGIPPAFSVSILYFNEEGDGELKDFGIKLCQKNYYHLKASTVNLYWKAIAIMFLGVILIIAIFYITIFISIYSRRHRFRRRVEKMNSNQANGETTGFKSFFKLGPRLPDLTEGVNGRNKSLFESGEWSPMIYPRNSSSWNDEKSLSATTPVGANENHSLMNIFPGPSNQPNLCSSLNDISLIFSSEKSSPASPNNPIAVRLVDDMHNNSSVLTTIATFHPKLNAVHISIGDRQSISPVSNDVEGNKKKEKIHYKPNKALSLEKPRAKKFHKCQTLNNQKVNGTRSDRSSYSSGSKQSCSLYPLSPVTSEPDVRRRTTSNAAAYAKNKQKKPHIKTVKILLLITLSFIISYTPLMLMHLEIIPMNKENITPFWQMVYYFYCLQNAMNPLIYALMNPAFRAAVWRIFFRSQSRRENPTIITVLRTP